MELTVHKTGADKAGKITVTDAVFGQKFNEALVHQVLVAYMAGGRAGTKAQKTRAEVRGGGRKPWKQKGTGRARVGTIRSPLWRGGGVTFAARPRDFSQKINRKMYRGALRSILSELVRQERLCCIEQFELDAPKTAQAKAFLKTLGLQQALIITDEVTPNAHLATRNLHGVSVIDTTELNPQSLVGHEHIVITRAAINKVEAWLS
ncbi:MAG: 50S ribosomal protein L4 [Gammaproteobacteria bacterium RIFCSPLOWO2_02_FULL_61_13]|nr:MAG: 50S ribosomal protein L4 [Gammaproteobacteria bacterium RIFCSPLOWO2_02_FULL_61_13]